MHVNFLARAPHEFISIVPIFPPNKLLAFIAIVGKDCIP
jgi:hypothetical protein